MTGGSKQLPAQRVHHHAMVMGAHPVKMLSFSERVMTQPVMAIPNGQRTEVFGASQVMVHSLPVVINRIHYTSPFNHDCLWYEDSCNPAYAHVESDEIFQGRGRGQR